MHHNYVYPEKSTKCQCFSFNIKKHVHHVHEQYKLQKNLCNIHGMLVQKTNNYYVFYIPASCVSIGSRPNIIKIAAKIRVL